MRLEDIIEEALIDRWIDKRTNKILTQMPHYEIRNNVIQVYTPVKAYKLVVLRRLLDKNNYSIKNIIIGKPDV